MKEIFRKEIMEKDVLNRILWDKKNFLSGNFCARKTAKQFLGPIGLCPIRVQSEPKGSDSDKKLNPADFDIYYLDRITKKLNKVKFTDIKFEGDFFSIGESLSLIPMHRIIRGFASELRGQSPRIRRITCKGEIVWSRR